MVMVALATYTKIDPAELAVFSPTVMRLLRNGLGFNGVIVSDDLGQAAAVQAVPAGTRAIDFLTAGGDLVTSQSLAPGRADGGRGARQGVGERRLPRHGGRRRAARARRQAGGRAAAVLI